MIYTNNRSSFPDQVVPQEEKMSLDYGLQVARAIEGEWFRQGVGGNRYSFNYNIFHQRRLYSRGEQSVQKYKDELSINGDLSYLNLDWKPVPVIPKFVDIVVNGMSDKIYDIKAYSQDPASQKTRTEYAEQIYEDEFYYEMPEQTSDVQLPPMVNILLLAVWLVICLIGFAVMVLMGASSWFLSFSKLERKRFLEILVPSWSGK